LFIDQESIEAWLKLLRYGEPVTVRGFQRLMGYNSPGKAQRILRRLERLGLAKKTISGEYIALKNMPPYLAAYMILRGYVLPRSLVIAVFITITAITYIILANPPLHIIALLIIVSIPNWIEAIHYTRSLKKIFRDSE